MQSRGRGQENQTHTETHLAISQKGVGVVIQTIIGIKGSDFIK